MTTAPASLAFDDSNWSTPQTVTLTALEDADATNDDTTLTHSASGVTEYDSLTAVDLVVTVTDNDTAGLTLTPAGTTRTVAEGSTNETYTVALTSAPSSTVTVSITPQDGEVTTAPASLAFDDSNWSTPQTVTLTALEDADATNDETTLTHSASGVTEYDDLTDVDLVVTVTDNDTAGLTLTPAATTRTVAEGSTNETYTVALTSAPSSTVTVSITPQNGEVTTAPASLAFDDSNWSTPQTVTLTALEDADATNDDTTLTHSASGVTEYDDLTAVDLVVTVTDNDTAGLTLTPAGTTRTVAEGSTSETYTVALTSAPSSTVTVSITPQDGEVTTAPASLAFDDSNWSTPQTVTLTALEDADATNDDTTLTHSASGVTEYDSLTAVDLVVTVTDNDTAGLTLTPAATTRTVAEGSTSETYTVALTSAPSSTVTVSITPQDGEVTTAPASLAFDDSNWSTPQTVTLTALEDADATNDDTTLTHSASGVTEYDEPH